MTATINTNGQTRKTLASQLDRLDVILDTLGEGLNEAVAQAVQQAVELAVREGVHQGVRGALSELLTNPEVLAVLRATLTPETPTSPTSPSSSESKPGLFARAWGRVKAGVQKAKGACANVCQRTRQAASTAWGSLNLLRPFRSQLLTALGVGTLAGIGAYFAGPSIAALTGWLAGVLSTLGIQAGLALRRTLMSAELTS